MKLMEEQDPEVLKTKSILQLPAITVYSHSRFPPLCNAWSPWLMQPGCTFLSLSNLHYSVMDNWAFTRLSLSTQ